MRNLGRLGFAMETLRLSASVVLILVTALSTGGLQFADQGCSHGDEIHAALSHEHDEDEGDEPSHADDAHGDACPPFCGDCQDCAGCFHPLATEAPALALFPVLFPLGRPDHLPLLAAQPPRWAPSPPLHVPRLHG